MIYLRGSTWYTDVRDPVSGARRRVSTGTQDQAKARVIAAQLAAGQTPQRASGNLPAPTGTATLGDALDLTWSAVWVNRKDAAGFRTLIRRAREYMGQVELEAVDYAKLVAFRAWLEETHGVTGVTANRHVAAVSKALTEATKRGLLKHRPPIPKSKEGRGRPLYMTADQVTRLIDAESDPILRAGWLLLTQAGIRISEALALTWQDVDLQGRWLRVGNTFGDTKSGQFRSIPLSRRVAQGLQDALAAGATSPMGHHAYAWWSDRWKLACQGIGFVLPKGTSTYVARHTTATLMIAAGLDVTEVQRILGHASVTTTQVYTKATPIRLQQAIEKLWD